MIDMSFFRTLFSIIRSLFIIESINMRIESLEKSHDYKKLADIEVRRNAEINNLTCELEYGDYIHHCDHCECQCHHEEKKK